MSCVHEFSLRIHTLVSNHALRAWILSPNAYFGLEPCFARKQTMLAGYEDRPHLIPASGRPPCGSVSAAGRRLYIAPACGRASAASLRPCLIPACVRASAAGLRMLCSHVRPACGGTLSRRAAGRRFSVQKQRYYSLTLLPPKGCRCTFCELH